MQQITTKQLPSILSAYANAKRALMVYGTYGIGKSEMTYQWSVARAEKMGREFIDWIRSPEVKIKDAMEHPEKYFAFIDIRLSQLDPSDLRGIPNFATTEEYLQLIPFRWVVYITKPEAAGTVFFDEINLAPDLIMSSAYGIINDRHIADKKISDNIAIFGAGNLTTDTSLVRLLPSPLKDRFGEVEMEFDVDYWFEAYANNHINPHLLAFCQWKKTSIHSANKDVNGNIKKGNRRDDNNIKYSTPRGVKRTSDLIKDLDITNEENHRLIQTLISSSVGEVFATEFMAYVKHFNAISWKDLLANPEEEMEKLGIDAKYTLIGGISERISKAAKTSTSYNTFFEQILPYLNLFTYMQTEYIIPTLNSLRPVEIDLGDKKDKIFKSVLAQLVAGICPVITDKKLKTKYETFSKAFKKKHNRVITNYAKVLQQITASK